MMKLELHRCELGCHIAMKAVAALEWDSSLVRAYSAQPDHPVCILLNARAGERAVEGKHDSPQLSPRLTRLGVTLSWIVVSPPPPTLGSARDCLIRPPAQVGGSVEGIRVLGWLRYTRMQVNEEIL
jgi:hypothetical protein